jgi:phospholipid/cholesterol/gamma-HCH transport system substrate-binding protein
VKLRREARWLVPIGVIVAVALVCAGYLLTKQRLALPFDDAYDLSADFESAAAVAPGLGEPVNVAGVRVGQISGVELKNGVGVVHMRIEPDKLPHVYEGARATLVPNTPAKDMQVDLSPGRAGGKALPHGATIPIEDTAIPVDADELLRALDTDTRDYMRLLIGDVGNGLHGRGKDLRSLLKSLGPTARQLRRISDLLASRRRELPVLVHNLTLITQAAGSEDRAVERVVANGATTFGALASADASLRGSLTLLPGTLGQARETLGHATPFARKLRTTLTALEPSVPRLRSTLVNAPDTLRGLLPFPIKALKRFTAAAGPLGAEVRATSRDLGEANPSLKRSFHVINQTTNLLAYNPGGGAGGYLFWFAWFAHNANSMISTEDAHGAVWRGLALGSCDSFAQSGAAGALLEQILGSSSGCP